MPSFWLAFLFIYTVALKWGVLPLMGWGSFAHVILPSITLALGFIPYYIRLIRSSMREEMKKPHVLFARARGVKRNGYFAYTYFQKHFTTTYHIPCHDLWRLIRGRLLRMFLPFLA